MKFATEFAFILTSVFTVWFFFKACGNKGLFLLLCLAWMSVLAVLAYQEFFQNYKTIPPRLFLAPGIPVFSNILVFALPEGRRFIETLNLKLLTWLHLVRIPVEIVLFFLCTQKLVPQIMTFEGSNPDILSGITAPLAVLLFFRNGKIKRYGLLIWNLICLGLLTNIVVIAALSAPTKLQQFAFEQPNLAIAEFPFVWLPGIVVPLVFFAHLVSIYLLLKKPSNTEL